MSTRIALIGFGEAGFTFAIAAGWGERASAYDSDPRRKLAMRRAGVVEAGSSAEALAGESLVLSLVTADKALDAAKVSAPFLKRNSVWCDMNSVAPQTKLQAAKFIEAAGGKYVDAAILGPAHPAGVNVPILLAGAAAEEARFELMDAGFANVNVVGRKVGLASTIKMIRSVMIKGIEALTHEMMAAAEAAGVVDEVLASLDASERSDAWPLKAAYNLERATTHGLRRAAEMEEAAKTLRSLGVEPVMTKGTIRRQREAASSKVKGGGPA